MFGYRSNVPKVRLTTDRLVVRLVHDRDAWRLADYYAENRHFLKPWEPVRDESHCYPSGWQARLGMINEFHKQGSAFYFGLFDPDEMLKVAQQKIEHLSIKPNIRLLCEDAENLSLSSNTFE